MTPWGHAVLVVAVVLAALLACARERARRYCVPLRGWPLLLLLVAAPSVAENWRHQEDGPRRALLYPQISRYITDDGVIQTAELDTVAANFGLIRQRLTPSTCDLLRARRPGIILLQEITFQGVAIQDYDGPDNIVGNADDFALTTVQKADTLWDFERQIQHTFIENLKRGCDWTYLTTPPRVPADEDYYGKRPLNMTEFCEVGAYGRSIGLTFMEYAELVYADIMDNPEFYTKFDGIGFDTMPPKCCFDNGWTNVDYDLDGDSDHCYNLPGGCNQCPRILDPADTCAVNHPWQLLEKEASDAFFDAVFAARIDEFQIIQISQDWLIRVDETLADRANGWKLEDWLASPGYGNAPCNQTWQCWWDGAGVPAGYNEAELRLDPFTGAQYDSAQGWEFTIVDVQLDGTGPTFAKRARFALGTAMLGDGYHASVEADLQGAYKTAEWGTWDVVYPALGAEFEREDPDNAAWDQHCRLYLRTNGDTVMVVVDPEDADAYLDVQGACCAVGGACTMEFEEDCTGKYQGDGTDCTPNPCGAGACCTPLGTCTLELEVDCTSPDVYQGDGEVCTPNPCPATTGACCDGSADCTITTEAGCVGTYLGDGIACSPNPCPLDITALPATLSVPDRHYRFNIAGAPDSTTFNFGSSTPAITVTGANITLDANGYLIAKTTNGSGQSFAVNAQGFVCNDMRTRNQRILWNEQGSTFNDCEFKTVNQGITFGTVGWTNTTFNRVQFLFGAGQVGLFVFDDARFESCLFVSAGTAQECMVVQAVADVEIINCTFVNQNTREALQTDQTAGTITLYNTIMRANNTLAFNATNPAWNGLIDSHNWYGRETGTNIIQYGGLLYTTGSAFEPNSRSGPLDFVNDDDTYYGDYSITNGGSGTDIGLNDPVTSSTDLAGDTRIQNVVVDMGAYESSGAPPPTGACCFASGNCNVVTEAACTGTYQGDDTTCTPNPCQPPNQGACCFSDGSCVVTTESLCTQAGSTSWLTGEVCTPNPCPRPGACCVALVCSITLLDDCAGSFLGEGTICEPDICLPTAGCPPAGYMEIETLPFTISTSNSKWAICGNLVTETTGAAILISGARTNVAITGAGVGSITHNGSGTRAGIWGAGQCDGLSIRDLTINQNNGDHAIEASGNNCNLNNITAIGGGFNFSPVSIGGNTFGHTIDSCSVEVSLRTILSIGHASTGHSSPDITITNNYFRINGGDEDGIGISLWDAHDLVFSDNTVITTNAGGSGAGDNYEPIKIYGADRPIFQRNYIRSTGRTDRTGGNVGFLSFRDNTITDYGTNNALITDNFIWSDFKALQAGGSGNHTIARNTIFGGMDAYNEHAGWNVIFANATDNSRYESNLIVGGDDRNIIHRSGGGADTMVCNTIVGLDGGNFSNGQWEVWTDQAGEVYARNNIIVSLDAGNPAFSQHFSNVAATLDFNYNLYYRVGSGKPIDIKGNQYTVAEFRAATTNEDNGIGAAPEWVTPLLQVADSLADFHLKDISPAVDAGDSTELRFSTDLDGNDRVVGDNVDLGCYEFGSVVPTLNGACCYLDGSCDVITESACASTGGLYEGDNTVCSPNPCPVPTGACCYDDGTCAVVTEASCTGDDGAWAGAGVTCVQAACPGVGACCFADGNCAVMLEADCDALLGDWLGASSSCTPDPCPDPTGACCVNGFDCYILTATECVSDSFGSYQGDGTPCVEDVTCGEGQGACCYGSFCQVTTESLCELGGGIYYGDRTDCAPTPCPSNLGACCIDGDCAQLTQNACGFLGGIWYGIIECDAFDCPIPYGSCCLLTSVPQGYCVITTEADCDAVNGRWTLGQECANASCEDYGVNDGNTVAIIPTTTWISDFPEGVPTNHCEFGDIQLSAQSPGAGGIGLLRFDLPPGLLPTGAVIVDAHVQSVVTLVGGTPEDVEVYSLRRDPVICEATWFEYEDGLPWSEVGGHHVPEDRLLPAIADQLGFGIAVSDTLMLAEGIAAREWVRENFLPDGTATLWVSIEAGTLRLNRTDNPPQLVLTYVLPDLGRRAKLQKQGR